MSLDKPMLTFIDCDSLYFQVCWKTKKKNEIRKFINWKLDRIQRLTGADELFLTVKGKDNYRHLLYPEYKANRPTLEPDMKKALSYAHQYMVEFHEAKQADGMEADDVVSIWAHEAREMDYEYVVAGIDKDLLQIPGKHFNFNKEEWHDISEDEGHRRLMAQCLTGDTTDNIPGIPRVGPKTAEKILSGIPFDRRWSTVVNEWSSRSAGDPTTSYYLLRMLTTWEERDEILESQIPSEPSHSEPDAGSLPREEAEPEQDVSGLSERDT